MILFIWNKCLRTEHIISKTTEIVFDFSRHPKLSFTLGKKNTKICHEWLLSSPQSQMCQAQSGWTRRGNNSRFACVNTRLWAHGVTVNRSPSQWGSIDCRLLPGRNGCVKKGLREHIDAREQLSGSIELFLSEQSSFTFRWPASDTLTHSRDLQLWALDADQWTKARWRQPFLSASAASLSLSCFPSRQEVKIRLSQASSPRRLNSNLFQTGAEVGLWCRWFRKDGVCGCVHPGMWFQK